MLAGDLRTVDGTGNNMTNPDWGSANTALLRLTMPDYDDGVSSPAGASRPGAREVSNGMAAQTDFTPNDRFLTDTLWQWGQFVDHDIDLTEAADPAEAFNIVVPTGDPSFDPTATGTQTIEMNRSAFDPATGTDASNPRQQINQITAYIDASNVYGSDSVRATALRTFVGGRLKTSAGDLLPFNTDGLPNAGGTGAELFLAGDVRSNEQVGLTAMHTLFVREHNRLADEIAAESPSLTDEEIYQAARRIVAAEIQVVTYNEFLPALLGPNALAAYAGYDPTVDPGISNLFSTAAYRLGHSLLSPTLERLGADGKTIAEGALALRDAFFNPSRITDEGGIEPLLRGLVDQLSQELDIHVVDDVRNFLFGPPGAGGFDLASLNMQRGRDHGLSSYVQSRVEMGLAAPSDFDDVSSDAAVAAALAAVYAGVGEVDAWIGGLAEDHLPGSTVGELIQTVLVEQFTRLRDGDRFWYENDFAGAELEALRGTTLADIIQRNTDITGLQDNVFFAPWADDGFWIQSLYSKVLTRPGSFDEWKLWIDAVLAGRSRFDVASGFMTSAENRAAGIEAKYHELLGRASDAGGVDYWMAIWDGQGYNAMVTGMLASEEYLARTGGNADDWLRSLYGTLLGRTTVSSDELAFWSAAPACETCPVTASPAPTVEAC